MNKIIFTTFVTFSILLATSVYAQQDKPQKPFDKKEFVAKRNAYIIATVGLTPEEAAEFIPLYNELEDKKFELGKECRKLFDKLRKKEKPTEAEYEAAINCRLDTEIKEAQLKKEYYQKFKKILSAEKLFKFQWAEKAFTMKFMENHRKNNREEPAKRK